MIEFLNEQVREQFHSLPVDLQMEHMDLALKFVGQGRVLRIISIDIWSNGDIEVDLRFEKFDSTVAV